MGFNRTGRRKHVLVVERGENVLRGDAQRGQSVMRERDEDTLSLLPDDIDLLYPWDMQ
ncbi:hypothetical protein D3C72_2349440 [compost metagenome]